jgi:hypothetical protein
MVGKKSKVLEHVFLEIRTEAILNQQAGGIRLL